MKILEFMSFNPGWFLTLPGILITSGVILLLIALILLLTSAKKEEEEENVSPVNSFTTPNVETPVAPEPVQINVPEAPAQEEIKPSIAEQPTNMKERDKDLDDLKETFNVKGSEDDLPF